MSGTNGPIHQAFSIQQLNLNTQFSPRVDENFQLIRGDKEKFNIDERQFQVDTNTNQNLNTSQKNVSAQKSDIKYVKGDFGNQPFGSFREVKKPVSDLIEVRKEYKKLLHERKPENQAGSQPQAELISYLDQECKDIGVTEQQSLALKLESIFYRYIYVYDGFGSYISQYCFKHSSSLQQIRNKLRQYSNIENEDIKVKGNVDVFKENFVKEHVLKQSKDIKPEREEDFNNSQAMKAVEELIEQKRIYLNLGLICTVIAFLIYWISAHFNYEALDYQSDDADKKYTFRIALTYGILHTVNLVFFVLVTFKSVPLALYTVSFIQLAGFVLVVAVYVQMADLSVGTDEYVGLNFGTVVTVGFFTFFASFFTFVSAQILQRIIKILSK